MSVRGCFVPMIMFALTPRPSAAQIACVAPANCSAATRTAREPVAVKVSDGPIAAGSRSVYLSPSSGAMDKSVVTTDASGIATAEWSGDRSNGEVVIRVSAIANNVLETREIHLGAKYTIAAAPDHFGDWFQNRQLRDPINIEIAVPPAADCSRAAIVFRQIGEKALVSPDTAWGALNKRSQCYATTRWKLADHVGTQSLTYSLVNDPTQRRVLTADSRAVPWIGVGLAMTTSSEFVRLDTKKATVKVTRRSLALSGTDSLEVSYDSTASTRGIDSVDFRWTSFAPVVGVNWPLYLPLKQVRLFTGADLGDPARNWFFGASILQVTGGWLHEDVPLDLQLVMQVSRRDVLTNEPACRQSPDKCDVKAKTRIIGGGLLLAFNGATALSELGKALLGK